ncbi:MAG: SpoIIE family protein phosphatase [Oscillospiraceae bacterium]|nr:SpoIIE family protein phosphatase [Oscillospiraceae bacterium]
MKNPLRSITFKSLTSVILLFVVFFAILSVIGYHGVTDALLTQYSKGAFFTARTAENLIDPDRMDEYTNSGGTTEEYLELYQELEDVCNSTSATFIYVIRPDLPDYKHITFIFSTINSKYNYTHYDFGYYRETTNTEYEEKYRALYEGKSEQELVIRDQGYIETDPHITAMIPLVGSDGQTKAILCVQRQMETMTNARNAFVKKVALAALYLALVMIVVQAFFMKRMLLKPVEEITEEASRFARENVTPEIKLAQKIHNKDEIGTLAGSIDQMEEQIQSYVEDLTRITAESERIRTELNLAHRIQTDMLPCTFPAFPDRKEFDIYASMDPAREVGGDFYDFYLIDDDHLCITIADVSGKGVPAALFMMASQIILANNTMKGESPAQVLANANASICSHNHEEMFVTVWTGILEISTGKLTAANGGHEYPVLKRREGGFELYKDKHSFVIGGMENQKFKEYELILEPGDMLLLYTDGVPEAMNAEGAMFTDEQMLAVLNEKPDASPEEAVRNIECAVLDFMKDSEQFDDMTMVCLRYNGRPGKPV